MFTTDLKSTFWNALLIFGGGMFFAAGLFCAFGSISSGDGLLAGLELAWRMAALPCLLAGLVFATLMTAHQNFNRKT